MGSPLGGCYRMAMLTDEQPWLGDSGTCGNCGAVCLPGTVAEPFLSLPRNLCYLCRLAGRILVLLAEASLTPQERNRVTTNLSTAQSLLDAAIYNRQRLRLLHLQQGESEGADSESVIPSSSSDDATTAGTRRRTRRDPSAASSRGSPKRRRGSAEGSDRRRH